MIKRWTRIDYIVIGMLLVPLFIALALLLSGCDVPSAPVEYGDQLAHTAGVEMGAAIPEFYGTLPPVLSIKVQQGIAAAVEAVSKGQPTPEIEPFCSWAICDKPEGRK